MLTRRGSIIIAAFSAIFCLLSVAYVSCTKVGSSPACNGVVCLNSGYCKAGHCKCPSGFEGANCGTAQVAKYFGTWNVHQTVVGSDSSKKIGQDSVYTVFLKKTATPTTFFMDNFLGNASYNDLLCTLDTLNSSNFGLDTLRDFNMWYEHVTIKTGSYGYIASNDTIINANVIIKYVNTTHNYQVDTLRMIMTPHHF